MTRPQTRQETPNRFFAFVRKTLLLAGIAGVGVWFGAAILPVLWQMWDGWAFDRQVRGEPATLVAFLAEKERQVINAAGVWLGLSDSVDEPVLSAHRGPRNRPLPEMNALVGRLSIPRLQLTTTVREGTRTDTLLLAAGHIRGTALPGSGGNVAVAGHRDTFFRSLAGIRDGDVIVFETNQGRYVYRVGSTEIVPPQDTSVLRTGRYSELTLVTCYPFEYIGSAPDRFIVKARQVPESALVNQVAAAIPPPAAPVPAVPTEPKTELSSGTATFQLDKHHSTQLAAGLWIGVDETDASNQQVNGWLWIMPDRRTVWLRDQAADDPLVFFQNGERRELYIAKVTDSSVSGYVLLPRDR